MRLARDVAEAKGANVAARLNVAQRAVVDLYSRQLSKYIKSTGQQRAYIGIERRRLVASRAPAAGGLPCALGSVLSQKNLRIFRDLKVVRPTRLSTVSKRAGDGACWLLVRVFDLVVHRHDAQHKGIGVEWGIQQRRLWQGEKGNWTLMLGKL